MSNRNKVSVCFIVTIKNTHTFVKAMKINLKITSAAKNFRRSHTYAINNIETEEIRKKSSQP